MLTITGITAGVLICVTLGEMALTRFATGFPYLESLAFAARPLTVGFAFGSGLAVAFLASIFPAWRALQFEPARALKGVD